MSYQNSPDSMHEISTLFTFACGVVAGAAVTLIFAPTAGRETRAFLAQRSRDVVDRGREMVIERGRNKAFEFGRQIGLAVEQGRAGFLDAIRHGRTLRGDEVRNAEAAPSAARGAPQYAADSAN